MRTGRRHVSRGAVVFLPLCSCVCVFGYNWHPKSQQKLSLARLFGRRLSLISNMNTANFTTQQQQQHTRRFRVFFAVPVVALNWQPGKKWPTINIIRVKKCRKPASKRTLDYCHKGLIKSRNSFLPVVTVPLNTVPVIWSKMRLWIIRATAHQRS